MKCTHIIMMSEMEWYPRSVRLASVQNKEDKESRKIYKIAMATKVCELETKKSWAALGVCSWNKQ